MVEIKKKSELYNAKQEKEIEIERNRNFQGQLVIKDYLELEKLHLRDVKKVGKIVLENLTQLHKCTIWNCDTNELMIKNCPRIKELNIRTNFLTSLEFVKNLEELESLEIYGNTGVDSGLEYLPDNLKTFSCKNTKLDEVLKVYNGDWKSCRKDIQELKEIKRPYELLKIIRDLSEEIKKLKKIQPTIIDSSVDFEKKYQELKKHLASLLEIKTQELNKITTSELKNKLIEKQENLKKEVLELKKQLSSLENFYFAKKLKIEQKEKELEELKKQIVSENKEIEEDLEEVLENQAELVKSNYSESWKRQLERSKKRLFKQIVEEKVNFFCQLQIEITQLKLEIQKNLNQVNQTFHIDNRTINQQIKNIQGFNIEGDNNALTNPSVQGNTMETIAYEEGADTELQVSIEAPSLNKQLEQ